jgi:hypothetical protein
VSCASQQKLARRAALWVTSAGAGLVRRPSGLPSIADILVHRHEPPQWAMTCREQLQQQLRSSPILPPSLARA